MKHDIQLRVNGELRGMAVEPNGTLLNVLLEDFRLTRTKEGCSVGECGACTVSIDGKLVNSCLVLAVDADGKDIVTMEKSTTGDPGFSSKMDLHPSTRAPGGQRERDVHRVLLLPSGAPLQHEGHCPGWQAR
jgi:aerobic-type carbon monoxide dehydrogenase small subunit (CoxS/CutS family)